MQPLSGTARINVASVSIPERLLQISALASEALRMAAATSSRPVTAACPALPSVSLGPGSMEISVTDSGAPDLSPGDGIVVRYLTCPSLTANAWLDGTLTMTLSASAIAGLGLPTQEFSGTLSAADLRIEGGTSVISRNQLQGILGFGYRDSPEQTLILATTDSVGLKVTPLPDEPGTAATLRNARLVREDDNTFALRRVTLQSDTTIETATAIIPTKARQTIEFQSAFGNGPIVGTLAITGDLGGSYTLQASGNLVDTSYVRSFSDTSTSEFTRPWSQIMQGFLWWDPQYPEAVSSRGYPFGSIAYPPMGLRSTTPSTATPLANPVALTVHLTARATQASSSGIVATRVDAAQPDIPVTVGWNHAQLRLTPLATLPPGSYQFRGTQVLQPESGAIGSSYVVNIPFTVSN